MQTIRIKIYYTDIFDRKALCKEFKLRINFNIFFSNPNNTKIKELEKLTWLGAKKMARRRQEKELLEIGQLLIKVQ